MNNVFSKYEMLSSRRSRLAFSLIELLTVIAIMSLLASVAVPALTSLAKGSQMNQSLIELSGTLDAARQYAISRNTYVWVALRHNPSGTAGDELSMVTLASKSGIDPSPWSNYGQVPNAQIDIVGQPRTFSQIRLEEAGVFDTSRIPALSGKPPVSSDNSLADGKAVFQIKLPGQTAPVDFSRVVQFTPAGEARVSSSVIDVVEIGIHPTRGSVADENNVAVLRVNGLTGQTSVFRP
jgi:prepilin-type N-terminal cleavage/methylation domain-containing protein